MKVTFVVYKYSTNTFNLVQEQLKGNNPKQEEWDAAAERALARVGKQGPDFLADVSITAVLKGLVSFETRAPSF